MADLTPSQTEREASPILVIGRVVYFLALLYLFFFSIELMSAAFKMGGRGFAEQFGVAEGLAFITGNGVKRPEGILSNSNITSVNDAAVETGKSAGGVLEAAQELSKQGEALRAEIEKFVNDDAA